MRDQCGLSLFPKDETSAASPSSPKDARLVMEGLLDEYDYLLSVQTWHNEKNRRQTGELHGSPLSRSGLSSHYQWAEYLFAPQGLDTSIVLSSY